MHDLSLNFKKYMYATTSPVSGIAKSCHMTPIDAEGAAVSQAHLTAAMLGR